MTLKRTFFMNIAYKSAGRTKRQHEGNISYTPCHYSGHDPGGNVQGTLYHSSGQTATIKMFHQAPFYHFALLVKLRLTSGTSLGE